ncbi:MAG: hypothetical protein EBS36_00050 [Actinobacteria bacterium]|nr:hypothetical protein [Actinomycetota bacterium]NBY15508.1 hypothetical protein [Actinomycetota bacterium]
MKSIIKYVFATTLLLVGFQGAPVQAVQANINGALSNFDTFNDTGKESHGFEIELDGVSSADVQYFFGAPYNRYGTPTVTDFSANGVSGVKVRWISQYDPVKGYANTTAMAPTNPTATDGHSCYLGGPAGATAQLYDASGCEHFGLGTVTNPTNVVYHWLVDDGTSSGQLVTADSPVAIPAPVWSMNNAGNVVAALPAPVQVPVPALPAKPDCALWGPAKWMKIYKTESHAPAQLGALLTDNPNVPQEPAEVETEWKFIQARPTCAEDGTPLAIQPDNEFVSEAPVGAGAESVTRRYEFFDYTGAYDDTDGGNHEALPLCDEDPFKLTCSGAQLPAPNADLGAYQGAQMVAANLALVGIQTPILAVTKFGDGTGIVTDGNGIGCGDLCSGAFPAGASVTLTALPDKGSHIAGWSIPACGISPTCTFMMTSDTTVEVEFSTAPQSKPVIADFSPKSADAGSLLSITGTNFSSEATVLINGVSAIIKSISATSITVLVPCAATSGAIMVQTDSGTASSSRFTRLVNKPKVSGLSPTTVKAGSIVTIKGSYLYCATNVTLNGNPVDFQIGTPAQMTFAVGAQSTTGLVNVITPAGSALNTTRISVVKPAQIASFAPTHGLAGAAVTITGSGFTGATKVLFNGMAASSFRVVNDSTVTAISAATASTGTISVINLAGTAVSNSNYLVDIPAPTITSISPLSVKVGSAVTITGKNFIGVTSVKLGNLNLQPRVISATSIVVGIPFGASTGNIAVTTNSGQATKSKLTVSAGVNPPKISALSNYLGSEGDQLRITGTNIGAASSVTFSGLPVNFSVTGSGTLSVRVPSNSSTSRFIVYTAGGSVSSPIYTVIGAGD